MNRNPAKSCGIQKKCIAFPLQNKTVLWIAEINKYIVAEPVIAEIMQGIWNEADTKSIVNFCISNFGLKKQKAENLTSEIKSYINDNLRPKNKPTTNKNNLNFKLVDTANFYSKKYYSINEVVFFVEYETLEAELINHPKLAHLEIVAAKNFNHHFQLYNSQDVFSLIVDGKLIDTWVSADSHFMGGKFSMQILQKIYKRKEDQWMGVFHASGITDGNNCVMFLGDSGNGKSTLSAILMANGLDVLNDDFLPVTSKDGLVCRFPSAISVKKQAYEILIPQFPELLHSEEYINPILNKTFRYLAPKSIEKLGVPCKALIFVKYDKNSDFNMEEISPEEAFAELIPDSWISPTPENAERFINWVSTLPCYRLLYSDNKKMIGSIKTMLQN